MIHPLSRFIVHDLTEGICGGWCTQQLARFGAGVFHWEASWLTRKFFLKPDEDNYIHSSKQRMTAYSEISLLKQWQSFDQEHACILVIEEHNLNRLSLLMQEAKKLCLLCLVIKDDVPKKGIPELANGYSYDADWYEILLQKEIGLLSMTGLPEKHAIPVGFHLCQYFAGVAAATGLLGGLLHAENHSIMERIEFSIFQAALHIMQVPLARLCYEANRVRRAGAAGTSISPSDYYQCQDGWIAVLLPTQEMWEDFIHMTGIPALFYECYRSLESRQRLHREIYEHVSQWALARTVQEAVSEGQLWRLPILPIPKPLKKSMERPWREMHRV